MLIWFNCVTMRKKRKILKGIGNKTMENNVKQISKPIVEYVYI